MRLSQLSQLLLGSFFSEAPHRELASISRFFQAKPGFYCEIHEREAPKSKKKRLGESVAPPSVPKFFFFGLQKKLRSLSFPNGLQVSSLIPRRGCDTDLWRAILGSEPPTSGPEGSSLGSGFVLRRFSIGKLQVLGAQGLYFMVRWQNEMIWILAVLLMISS